MRVEAWHDNDDILGSQVGRILLIGETNASFIPPHPIRRPPMTFHKRILQWQAEHPNITWAFWGVVWAIVLILLFWPKPLN
jgi:hypothetical protein